MVGHLADELARTGHSLAVYAQRPRRMTYPATHPYDVYRFADWVGHPEFPIAPGLLLRLLRDARTTGLLHAHSFHAAPAIMAASVPGVPLVFTPHFHSVGHTRIAQIAHVAYDPLAKLLFQRCARIICVSQAEADLLLRRYPRVESRLTVVPLGVDAQALASARPIHLDARVVLVAGRLEPYKNVDLVVRAFAALRANVRDEARLVICGGGTAFNTLRQVADQQGVGHLVDVLGPLTDDNLRRWQATAHVTVSVSSREAFGLVVLEGAAAGGHVIASDIPSHREIRQLLASDSDRVTLVPIVSEGSPEHTRANSDWVVTELAVALEEALGRPRPGTPISDRFDWANVAAAYARIYTEVR